MATTAEIEERNHELARTINEEARRDPASPYAGKLVGIANGQVVAAADDMNDLVRDMRQKGIDPRDTVCFIAGANPTEAEECFGWTDPAGILARGLLGFQVPPDWVPPPRVPRTEVQKRNEELAQKINEEALGNSQSPYAGKWVGLANGEVVAVADDLQELVRRLRQAEPDPQKTFIIEASRDYTEDDYIW